MKGYDLKILYGRRMIVGAIFILMFAVANFSKFESDFVLIIIFILPVILFINGIINIRGGQQEKKEAEKKKNLNDNSV